MSEICQSENVYNVDNSDKHFGDIISDMEIRRESIFSAAKALVQSNLTENSKIELNENLQYFIRNNNINTIVQEQLKLISDRLENRTELPENMGEPRSISCTKKYIHLIRQGKKTVEGRANDPKYRNIKQGDLIRLYDRTNKFDDVVCLVKSIEKYSSFKDMLTAEGIENCLPGQNDVDAGVNIYRSFPNYETKESELGVLAFKLELFGEESTNKN